ncbi:hypothetical protein C8R43DRAFT_1105162 [Mycena crocata]|nr:hypothetical protein C8R43DRAFT_1105162 [Mycena crocata]
MHHLLQLSFSLTYPLSLCLSSFRTTTTAAISFPVLPANWERSPTWVRVYSTAKPPGTSTPRSDPPGGKINRPTPARPVANFRRVVADVDYYDYYIYRRPASRDKFQVSAGGQRVPFLSILHLQRHIFTCPAVAEPPRSGGDRDYGFIEAPRAGSNPIYLPVETAGSGTGEPVNGVPVPVRRRVAGSTKTDQKADPQQPQDLIRAVHGSAFYGRLIESPSLSKRSWLLLPIPLRRLGFFQHNFIENMYRKCLRYAPASNLN